MYRLYYIATIFFTTSSEFLFNFYFSYFYKMRATDGLRCCTTVSIKCWKYSAVSTFIWIFSWEDTSKKCTILSYIFFCLLFPCSFPRNIIGHVVRLLFIYIYRIIKAIKSLFLSTYHVAHEYIYILLSIDDGGFLRRTKNIFGLTFVSHYLFYSAYYISIWKAIILLSTFVHCLNSFTSLHHQISHQVHVLLCKKML